MSRRTILFAISVLGFFAASALTLHAQVGGIPSPYGPPPLSPWLNLYQKQGGPVDNYHMFVQPQLQMNNYLQGQQMGIQRNSAGLNAVGERLQTQTEANYAAPEPTGAATGFFNHRAYFNNFRGVNVPAPGASFGGSPAGVTSGSGASFAGTSSGVPSGGGGGNSWAPPPSNNRGTSGLGR